MAPGEAPKRHSVRTVLHARRLAETQGMSISAIAREIDVCWRTVKRWLDPQYADEVRGRVRDSYRAAAERTDDISRG